MKQIWLVSAAVLALGGSMLGDTITSATGSFSAFPTGFASSTPTWISNSTPTPTSGVPFWNSASDDTGVGGSHSMNIGYLLTDSGGFLGTPSVLGTDTVVQDFIASGGADPSSFSFLRSAITYNISLLFGRSSLDTGNPAVGTVFGYYVGNQFTPIYDPQNTNSPTGTEAFNPTTAGNSYGFYATVCYGVGACETYTTGNGNSGNMGGAAGWNHFAVFQLASGSYVIGFEDANGYYGENLGDYNDVVVELQVVPEPGTIAITGLGLAGLALWRVRQRKVRTS
ncbi:MAG TPA: PEP-CTERM sorting domain-containing protein [Bryobacteraceae bacterium]|nr:PEP-CTERM sorting domain-containing protein [Bryobacteraceae bacterium]